MPEERRLGQITHCGWCGDKVRRRGSKGDALCDNGKCHLDANASRKNSISTIEMVVKLIETNLACPDCLRRIPIDLMAQDHAVPRAKGGGDEPDNIRVICSSCNNSKGDRDYDDWISTGLRWEGCEVMTFDQAKNSLRFFIRHKRLEQRCRGLLDNRITPHTDAEVGAAAALFDWIANNG